MIFCFQDSDGEPVSFINRPEVNRNVEGWLKSACEIAIENRAFVIFHCDTAKQAKHAAKKAAKLLPGYRRVALERMYDPATRVQENLS
jgi:hypothetical protein